MSQSCGQRWPDSKRHTPAFGKAILSLLVGKVAQGADTRLVLWVLTMQGINQDQTAKCCFVAEKRRLAILLLA